MPLFMSLGYGLRFKERPIRFRSLIMSRRRDRRAIFFIVLNAHLKAERLQLNLLQSTVAGKGASGLKHRVFHPQKYKAKKANWLLIYNLMEAVYKVKHR